MKTAIVTGAFGFAGANLCEYLLEEGYKVYAIGREGSAHNTRLSESGFLRPVFLPMEEYDRIPEYLDEKEPSGDIYFFNLAWGGARDDEEAQAKNVEGALLFFEAALRLKSNNTNVRFIGIGSQAEYGEVAGDEPYDEDTPLCPITAYGRQKARAYELLKEKAKNAEIYFVWGRIFSLIGKYEPSGRMLPDLLAKLESGNDVFLSSCEQYWDYMDAGDGARAIAMLGERGCDGQAYNIADGRYRVLKEFVYEAADILGADRSLIHFGERAKPFISIRPSVLKLKRDTGFEPKVTFKDSICLKNWKA